MVFLVISWLLATTPVDTFPPGISVPADSIRNTDNPDWLQYWFRGEPWVRHRRTGAWRHMRAIVSKYEFFEVDVPGTVQRRRPTMYPITENGRERYALLDSLLNDRVPDSLEMSHFCYLHLPDGSCLIPVKRSGLWGVWSLALQKPVIPCRYDEIGQIEQYTGILNPWFQGGSNRCGTNPADAVWVRQGEYVGLLRLSDGALLLPCELDYLEHTIDGYGLLNFVKQGDRNVWNYASGKTLPPACKIYSYQKGDDSLITVINGHLFGFFNTNLEEIIPVRYRKYFSRGRFIAVCRDSLWDIYDRSGERALPLQFQDIRSPEGLSGYILRRNEKEALFDENLKPLTGFDFDEIVYRPNAPGRVQSCLNIPDSLQSPLNDSYSLVGLLDSLGREILAPQYMDLIFCPAGILVQDVRSGKYGLLGADLSRIWPPVFDRLRCRPDGTYEALKAGVTMHLDAAGHCVSGCD